MVTAARRRNPNDSPFRLRREETADEATKLLEELGWKTLRPHPVQTALWNSPKRFCAAAAGRGSGKTLLARRKTIKSLLTPKAVFFYALPTYAQAKRVAWVKFKEEIPPRWLDKPPNETDLKITTIFGSTLYVVGMDKPQRLEGDQYTGGVLDEMVDQKPGCFESSIRPALSDKKGWCWLIGAIKEAGIGSAWFEEFINKASQVWSTETQGLVDRSGEEYMDDLGYYNWPSGDIWTPEEVESARRAMDERTFQTQIESKWLAARGGIYHAFSDDNVTAKAAYQPNQPIVVGSDFNVDPMAWVIGHFYDGKFYVFDELYIRNTNTQEALDRLYDKYGHHSAGWAFFGDAAGKHRKTSAATTDYLIIKNDTRFRDASVHYPDRNPLLADRFAASNAAIRNAKGELRVFINPACRYLIRDLKFRCYKEGTREPNDQPGIGHMADAFDYPVWKLFPFRLDEQSNATSSITAR